MSDDLKPTQRLNIEDPELLEALLKQQNRELGTSRLGKAREVLLLVDSGIRKIELRNEVSYLLGRFSKSKPRGNHIDLSPFAAQDRGVSRIHAQIHMEDDQLFLTDMDSTNGTYLDGVKLQAHQQYQLRQGSNIILGRMHMQVMYKSAQDVAEAD
jgi:pSer/pThr/pTyr-binding forkhead associated (FHA) protein